MQFTLLINPVDKTKLSCGIVDLWIVVSRPLFSEFKTKIRNYDFHGSQKFYFALYMASSSMISLIVGVISD